MRIKKAVERWFPCDGDPDGGKVLIRHLAPGERSDIMDEVFEQTVEYVQAEDTIQPVFKQSMNKKADREKTIVAAVKDWENFFDEKGKPLKCTDANKIRALREIDGFAEFVTDRRNRLAEDIAKEEKAQEKN